MRPGLYLFLLYYAAWILLISGIVLISTMLRGLGCTYFYYSTRLGLYLFLLNAGIVLIYTILHCWDCTYFYHVMRLGFYLFLLCYAARIVLISTNSTWLGLYLFLLFYTAGVVLISTNDARRVL